MGKNRDVPPNFVAAEWCYDARIELEAAMFVLLKEVVLSVTNFPKVSSLDSPKHFQ
jgi:hypothetical protein